MQPTCDFIYTVDVALSNSSSEGVHCITNDKKFTISDSNVGTALTPKKFTMNTANGHIDLSGENVHIVPADAGDGMLGYSGRDDPSAIQWAGNLGSGQGLF